MYEILICYILFFSFYKRGSGTGSKNCYFNKVIIEVRCKT